MASVSPRRLFALTILTALAAAPAVAQTSADRLADQIVQAQSPGPASAEAPTASSPGPRPVSALDVVTKLSALVVIVYALTWGLRLAQRRGLLQGLPAAQALPGSRLQRIADLPLRAGSSLHLVEADGRRLLVAFSSSGQVSLLDLASPPSAPAQASGSATPASEDPFNPRALAALKQDDDWEQRRESLIRALSQRG